MIKQHVVRPFERRARRNHTPNIGLKTDTCEVTFDMEDSSKILWGDSSNFLIFRVTEKHMEAQAGSEPDFNSVLRG